MTGVFEIPGEQWKWDGTDFGEALDKEMKLIERDIQMSLCGSTEIKLTRGCEGKIVTLDERTCTFCDEPTVDETSRCAVHRDEPCSHCGDDTCSYDDDC